MVNFTAVYVLWLREMKRYVRAKSRIISSLTMPFLFLVAMGFGFRNLNIPGLGNGTDYLSFLIPGIIGMGIMTSSLMAGLSILWDREFGFLKEIMIAPVSRYSIVLGRVAGNVTTSIIQGLLIAVISIFLGFQISTIQALLLFFLVMILISVSYVGLGLLLTSVIKDMQGFGSIMSLVMMPMVFLSGAFYPVNNLPGIIQLLSYLTPLTYGIDALRGIVIGASIFNPITDIIILTIVSATLLTSGAVLFDKTESV
ncbi:multidrug ABC transporter permease [archaeon CG07_land_8_20_14_0_80_38_8]|nr:MAG: multidrug ABC transporter permease [archaeon CG07_land_8_20_14_0_80_38_8]PIU89065.1 MAG: multidrug ABC transporter permease [archaeon CG06_land_8_20_14_3_00_37_11]